MPRIASVWFAFISVTLLLAVVVMMVGLLASADAVVFIF